MAYIRRRFRSRPKSRLPKRRYVNRRRAPLRRKRNFIKNKTAQDTTKPVRFCKTIYVDISGNGIPKTAFTAIDPYQVAGGCQGWKSYTQMYDQGKLKSVYIRYETLMSKPENVGIPLNMVGTTPMFQSGMDRDSFAVPDANPDNNMGNASVSNGSIYKSHKQTFKPKGAERTGWININGNEATQYPYTPLSAKHASEWTYWKDVPTVISAGANVVRFVKVVIDAYWTFRGLKRIIGYTPNSNIHEPPCPDYTVTNPNAGIVLGTIENEKHVIYKDKSDVTLLEFLENSDNIVFDNYP